MVLSLNEKSCHDNVDNAGADADCGGYCRDLVCPHTGKVSAQALAKPGADEPSGRGTVRLPLPATSTAGARAMELGPHQL